jgi:hypothetical protein
LRPIKHADGEYSVPGLYPPEFFTRSDAPDAAGS